jgi:putative membrane protein
VEIFAAYFHLASIMVFGCLLSAEWALCNEHLQPGHVGLLARIDTAYIAAAVLVLLSGLLLLVGYDRHVWSTLTHPVFWTKFGMFVALGAAAVYPSLQFQRWNRAIAKGEERILTTRDIRRTRRVILVELAVLAIVPLLAAWLARGAHPAAIRP